MSQRIAEPLVQFPALGTFILSQHGANVAEYSHLQSTRHLSKLIAWQKKNTPKIRKRVEMTSLNQPRNCWRGARGIGAQSSEPGRTIFCTCGLASFFRLTVSPSPRNKRFWKASRWQQTLNCSFPKDRADALTGFGLLDGAPLGCGSRDRKTITPSNRQSSCVLAPCGAIWPCFNPIKSRVYPFYVKISNRHRPRRHED